MNKIKSIEEFIADEPIQYIKIYAQTARNKEINFTISKELFECALRIVYLYKNIHKLEDWKIKSIRKFRRFTNLQLIKVVVIVNAANIKLTEKTLDSLLSG